MPGTPHDPELSGLEAALSQLTPLAGSLSRDTVVFQAGQASVRGRWWWPAATVVAALTAAVLAVLLITRPPHVVERIVYLPARVEEAPRPDQSVSPSSSVEPGP